MIKETAALITFTVVYIALWAVLVLQLRGIGSTVTVHHEDLLAATFGLIMWIQGIVFGYYFGKGRD